MSVRSTLLRNGVLLLSLAFSIPYAQARDADQDCEVLKQVIGDAKNSFRNVRDEANPHRMDSATTYPVSVVFPDSQWYSVVINTDFFNENYNCDLRNTSVEGAASLVKQCLGNNVSPDPKYQADHFKVFNVTGEHSGTVHIYQGAFVDLVKISVIAAEPE